MRSINKLIWAAALSVAAVPIAAGLPAAASGSRAATVTSPAAGPTAGRLLASGLKGTIGGVIGPDGALYVPEATLGRITRVDPRSGHTSTFADGLPPMVIPLGGAMDVAFVGKTAYALVTLVSPDLGGTSIDGIYRMDDPHHWTVVADIGKWSSEHVPTNTQIDVRTGLQYAFEPVRGGFLVSDGHHNRVLRVSLHGDVSQLIAFDDVAPTGLAVAGDRVFMAEAGALPEAVGSGKVVEFTKQGGPAHDVATGFSVMVDVERVKHHGLFALSMGDPPGPNPQPADPAQPDSGKLLRVNRNGTFSVLVDRLDRPTSVHFVGTTALVVTLNGEVWRIDEIAERD
jgi:hypothetical protein